jgi:hypothetical protein
MSEPVSSGAAGIGLFKLAAAGGLGAALAAIIVMAGATPQTKKEWVVALTSTVATSLLGGAALIQWWGIAGWATQGFIGLAGLIGICFAAGLPAWVAVRAFFKYADKNKDKDLLDMAREVKDSWKKD